MHYRNVKRVGSALALALLMAIAPSSNASAVAPATSCTISPPTSYMTTIKSILDQTQTDTGNFYGQGILLSDSSIRGILIHDNAGGYRLPQAGYIAIFTVHNQDLKIDYTNNLLVLHNNDYGVPYVAIKFNDDWTLKSTDYGNNIQTYTSNYMGLATFDCIKGAVNIGNETNNPYTYNHSWSYSTPDTIAGSTVDPAPTPPPPPPTPTPTPTPVQANPDTQDFTPRDLKITALAISLGLSAIIIKQFRWRTND